MRLGLPGDDEDDLDDGAIPAPEGVAVTTRYLPLLLGYALCTPTVVLDGRPVAVVGWGRVIIPAPPGEHHIHVEVPLFGSRRVGVADCTAVVTEGDNPTVVSVGLGNVNGVTLGYLSNLPMGGSASVKKILRTYTITGQATGINISNPLQPARKNFEFKVRCP